MTELQVKAAQLAEERRHNLATEKLSSEANKAQADHYAASDRYTEEHYIRSDQAGLISANASAMNAQASLTNAETNRLKYNMDYDIEYGWTGNTGYPSGMPLSAQKKNAELEILIMPDNSTLPAAQLQRMLREKEIEKLNADIAKVETDTEKSKTESEATKLTSVTNAIKGLSEAGFGKQGIITYFGHQWDIAAPRADYK